MVDYDFRNELAYPNEDSRGAIRSDTREVAALINLPWRRAVALGSGRLHELCGMHLLSLTHGAVLCSDDLFDFCRS